MNQISQVTPTKSDNTLIIVLSILGVTGIAGFIIWKTFKKKSDTGGQQGGQQGGQAGQQGGGWGGEQSGQQTGQSGGAAQNILDLISGIFKPRVGTPPIVANQTTTTTTPNTTTTTTRPTTTTTTTTTNQTPASVPFRQAVVATKSGNLNIRNSPNGSQIGSLKKGTQILVRSSNVSGWLEYSKDGKNVSGYVSSQYVK